MDEDLPDDYYTEAKMKEIETMYIGTESMVHKRFQRSGPYGRQFFARLRSRSRDLRYGGFPRQSRFDGPRSGDGKNITNRD